MKWFFEVDWKVNVWSFFNLCDFGFYKFRVGRGGWWGGLFGVKV